MLAKTSEGDDMQQEGATALCGDLEQQHLVAKQIGAATLCAKRSNGIV